MDIKGYEFIMEFPNKQGKWEKYLCSYDISIGDNVFSSFDTFDYKWREHTHLFDIKDPHIVKSFDYDTLWKETNIITSHGYGRKRNYFKIVKKLDQRSYR